MDPEKTANGVDKTGHSKMSDPVTSAVRLQRNQAEKQRRDRLNGYISELATLVPMVKNSSKPVDKVSVLRLAAAHMRLNISCLNPARFKSKLSVLPSSVASYLEILEKNIGGFIVATTFAGVVVFCSKSVEDFLGYQNIDFMGQSIYSYVPNKEISNFEKKVNSIISRYKKGNSKKVSKSIVLHLQKRPLPRTNDISYQKVVIKISIHSNEIQNDPSKEEKTPAKGKKMLKHKDFGTSAVILMFIEPVKSIPKIPMPFSLKQHDVYVTLHGIRGEIIEADHNISTITGYMPCDVLGKSAYEYIFDTDVPIAQFAQKAMFTSNDGKGIITYRLRTFDMKFIFLQSTGFLFKDSANEIQRFVCYNRWLSDEEGKSELKKFQERFSPASYAARQLEEAQKNCSDKVICLDSPEEDTKTNGTLNDSSFPAHSNNLTPISNGVQMDSNDLIPISNGVQMDSNDLIPIANGVQMDSNDLIPIANGVQMDSNDLIPIANGVQMDSNDLIPIANGVQMDSNDLIPIANGVQMDSNVNIPIAEGTKNLKRHLNEPNTSLKVNELHNGNSIVCHNGLKMAESCMENDVINVNVKSKQNILGNGYDFEKMEICSLYQSTELIAGKNYVKQEKIRYDALPKSLNPLERIQDPSMVQYSNNFSKNCGDSAYFNTGNVDENCGLFQEEKMSPYADVQLQDPYNTQTKQMPSSAQPPPGYSYQELPSNHHSNFSNLMPSHLNFYKVTENVSFNNVGMPSDQFNPTSPTLAFVKNKLKSHPYDQCNSRDAGLLGGDSGNQSYNSYHLNSSENGAYHSIQPSKLSTYKNFSPKEDSMFGGVDTYGNGLTSHDGYGYQKVVHPKNAMLNSLPDSMHLSQVQDSSISFAFPTLPGRDKGDLLNNSCDSKNRNKSFDAETVNSKDFRFQNGMLETYSETVTRNGYSHEKPTNQSCIAIPSANHDSSLDSRVNQELYNELDMFFENFPLTGSAHNECSF